MANYNKSFNFRNGVQIDDDNFIVNANGLVGIGTSVPTESLDVYGTAKITGLVTATSISTPNLNISGIATITTLKVGIVTANSGIATYYGDGSKLSNLPTSQWIDVNTGIGVTSIYAAGAVGVATNYPVYYFQVGSNPNTQSGVGINSTGSIKASGIITASSFSGSGTSITSINADNISSGTLSNSRLPSNINVSGIITATNGFDGNLTGNVVGIASTANSITTTANITVNSINSGFSTTGISTIYTTLNVPGKIGVGTLTPSADINIRRTGISSIQLTSDGSYESTITFGRNVNFSTNNAQIRFGNTNLAYTSSTEQSLDIINYDTGNINFYLNPGGSGTGSFIWFKPSLSKSMVLTSSGNLGINSNSPTNTLSVVGTANISSNTLVGGALTVSGGFVSNTLAVSGNSILTGNVGISTASPTYTLQIGNNPSLGSGVGISSSGNIIASGIVTTSGDIISTGGNIIASGSITATNGDINATNGSIIVAQNITATTGSITASQNITATTGNITATSGSVNATNGFTSGIGTAVQISTVGNQLFFTVVGVGSTSLTLY